MLWNGTVWCILVIYGGDGCRIMWIGDMWCHRVLIGAVWYGLTLYGMDW